MRRFIIIGLIILVSVSVISCSKDKDKMIVDNTLVTVTPEVVEDDSNAVTENTEEVTDADEVADAKEDKATANSYEIKEMVYEKDKIIIKYPQIAKLEDSNKQALINELILADAMKDVEESTAEGATLEVDYEISWKGEKLLSIKYIVYFFYPGAAHPSHSFYTTNINISQASKVKLSDTVKINDSFVSTFIKESKYVEPFHEAKQDLVDMLADDLNSLSTTGLLGSDNATDYTPYYSYYTEDSLGIGMEVAFAIGGYALYEIPYENILPYLKPDQEVWQDFPELLSLMEQTSSDNVQPAEEVFMPIVVYDLLLGAYDGKKWIDLEETLPRLKGGETYQLFSENTPVGTQIGKAPALDIDFQNFYMVEMENAEMEYSIAVGTETELDYGKVRRAEPSYYEKLVNKYFKKIGHPEYTIGSLEGYSFDFDQDGTEEELIFAYQYLDQFYYEVPAEGCYSYLFYYDNDSMEILKEAYRSTVDEDTIEYLDFLDVKVGDEIIIASRPEFLGVIDITGDGNFEVVIVDSGYESWGFEVFELSGEHFNKVLEEGFGV